MDKVHDFEEVTKHNHRADCWLIISGKVYDVTSFLEDHPGGDEIMLAATANVDFIWTSNTCSVDQMYKTIVTSIFKISEKDATEDFEEVGHSDSAKEMMEKYYIGEVDKSTIPIVKRKPPPRVDQKPKDTGIGASKILQFLIPLLVLGLGFALRYLKKDD